DVSAGDGGHAQAFLERRALMRGDRVLSWLVVSMTAAMGLHGMTARPQPLTDGAVAGDGLDTSVAAEGLDARVTAMAEAIAVAEGYYAEGEHDGHSLPYRLNNPGALKKPALGAAILLTWQDSGLVIFPSAEMGWAALRHQVRLMLAGGSHVYDPADTILTVAVKYT